MSESIIDRKGNIIYTAYQVEYYIFSDGLCAVLPTKDSSSKWGYINQSGQMVIPCQFDDAEAFHGGVAKVKKNGKWGLINCKGKLICPYYNDEKDDVDTIHDGIIRKWEDGGQNSKLSYIDIDGNEVFDTSAYSWISDFCNGYATVEKDNVCALINTKGEVVIPFGKYNKIGAVHCGVVEVGNSMGVGYANISGIEVVPLGKYDSFYWHHPELSVVCAIKGEKCGYIDKSTGQEIVPCNYQYDRKSTNAAIHGGGSMFVIKLKDHVLTSNNEIYVHNVTLHKSFHLTSLDDIASYYSEGLCAVLKNGKVGFIDDTCKLVIPFQFECPNDMLSFYVLRFNEGICAINNMFIDKQGCIIKRFYAEPHYLCEGVYYMDKKTGKGRALVNIKGELIWEGFDIRGLDREFPIAVLDERPSQGKKEKWHFINKDGRKAFSYLVEEDYHPGHNEFRNGYAIITGAKATGRAIGRSTTSTINRNTQQSPAASSTKQNTSSGCYIATAVYGSYDCPEVWTLRRYRDSVLDNSWYGQLFIRCYYAVSPTLVKWFGKASWFRNLFRKPLNKWVKKLNEQGVENTPYTDKY